MQKVAELSQGDVKLAIEFWMYNRHRAVVRSGQNIKFLDLEKNDPLRVMARVEYVDDNGISE